MDLERDIEEKLINRLTQGVSQWTRRDDIKTVSQLWDNFFKILSKNNKAQLHDQPLTENEKNTIRIFIPARTNKTLFIPMQQIIQQPVTSAFHIGICLIKPSRIPRIPDRSGTSDE